MCTAITIKNENGYVLFGRTMDFSYELDPEIYVVNKDYEWISSVSKNIFKTKYKFVATGQDTNDLVFADGCNEEGLGVAALYFKGFASFEENINEDKINLSNLEVIKYLLGNFKNVNEVIESIKNVNIIGDKDDITNTITPLHWIVADKSGRAITIEKTKDGLNVHNNPMGVLTNSPDFKWHTTNLRNYLNLSDKQIEKNTWNNLVLTPFGQGAGSYMIPGDYTSPSRFVRATFQKSFIDIKEDKDGIESAFNLFKTVFIPKGVVLTSKGTYDYTQYTVLFDLNTMNYYYNSYYDNEIKMINVKNTNSDGIVFLGKIKK